MDMPGRNYTLKEYRYGYNGKENDKEFSGGTQDYGFRVNDTRLGRFFSKDPLARNYSFKSPYDFAENSPIWGIDLDGLELSVGTYANSIPKFAAVKKVSAKEIKLRLKASANMSTGLVGVKGKLFGQSFSYSKNVGEAAQMEFSIYLDYYVESEVFDLGLYIKYKTIFSRDEVKGPGKLGGSYNDFLERKHEVSVFKPYTISSTYYKEKTFNSWLTETTESKKDSENPELESKFKLGSEVEAETPFLGVGASAEFESAKEDNFSTQIQQSEKNKLKPSVVPKSPAIPYTGPKFIWKPYVPLTPPPPPKPLKSVPTSIPSF
jgi:RHS repeat-associated protein